MSSLKDNKYILAPFGPIQKIMGKVLKENIDIKNERVVDILCKLDEKITLRGFPVEQDKPMVQLEPAEMRWLKKLYEEII